MKKTHPFIIGIAMLFSMNMKAQITLEHTFDSAAIGGAGNFYCTDIGNNDFKYVFLNAPTNSFSLYNLDMTPYMTNIVIPATGDSLTHGFTVMYVTKELFDCDSTNIEYAYDYFFDVNHTFRVYRTDGTLLLEVDSANGPMCDGCYGGSFAFRPIINTVEGAKLFLQKRNSDNVPQMLVYSLCGKLPNNIYDLPQQETYLKVFPNPASRLIHFEFTPPNNFEEFQVLIFDAAGREQKRFPTLMSQGKYALNVNNFSSGSYSYSLITKNKVYQSGKFIITN